MTEELKNERKENIYTLINDDDYRPLKFKELCYLLQIGGRDKDDLLEILNELVDEGRIEKTSKGIRSLERVSLSVHSSAIREDLDLSVWKDIRKISLYHRSIRWEHSIMIRC